MCMEPRSSFTNYIPRLERDARMELYTTRLMESEMLLTMRFRRNGFKINHLQVWQFPDTMFYSHQYFWIHSILSFKCFADAAIAACSWSSKDRCRVLRIPFLPMIAGMLRQQSNLGWKWQTGLISRLSKRIEQHRFADIEAIPNTAEPLPCVMTRERCL